MLKVIVNNGKKSREVKHFYRDVSYDTDGWADAKKWIPADYDLVWMRIKNRKTIVGWAVGKKWYGLRLRHGDEVEFWKKKPEEVTI